MAFVEGLNALIEYCIPLGRDYPIAPLIYLGTLALPVAAFLFLLRMGRKKRGQRHMVKKTDKEGPLMYVTRMDAVLNRWFTSYAEASASLASEGGYLLPYKGQFFVTLSEGIRELGIDPDDPDWERIGWDWVRPKHNEAWTRLKEKREQVI